MLWCIIPQVYINDLLFTNKSFTDLILFVFFCQKESKFEIKLWKFFWDFQLEYVSPHLNDSYWRLIKEIALKFKV